MVGVPEIAPAADIAKPGGRLPEARLQAKAGVPPVAAKIVLYAVPAFPPGTEAVETARGAVVTGAAPMATLKVFVAATLAVSLT